MRSTSIDKSKWRPVLDRISQLSHEKQITLEIDSAAIGAQKEATNVTFRGISYDPSDDAVSVYTDDLEHAVQKPSKIEFAFDDTGLACIEIVDANGAQHLVKFATPLDSTELEHL